jgi:hypothetical protein
LTRDRLANIVPQVTHRGVLSSPVSAVATEQGEQAVGRIYTPETIGAQAQARKLKPGDRLWVAGDRVENGAYRAGNSPSNAAVYLRWRDVDIAKTGKIEPEELGSAVVRPGQGLSLFIEKVVHADFNHIGSQDSQCGKAALAALAKEKGYSEASQIHWFQMDSGRVVPAGLEVVFDNDPPGHCTLTVTREMTALEFLTLISDHLGFSYVGTDIFGKH